MSESNRVVAAADVGTECVKALVMEAGVGIRGRAIVPTSGYFQHRVEEALDQALDEAGVARDELAAPGTETLVKQIKGRTGSEPDLSELKTTVEEAIKALKMSQSRIETALADETDVSVEAEGITNLPAYLQRFIAERAGQPGFSYTVTQDSVRGWIIRWKEYTHRGTVRGYGQICERPYAWLDE